MGLSPMKIKTASDRRFNRKHILVDYNKKWQIIFKQYSNPQPIEYMEIRRVGYIATLQCVVNQSGIERRKYERIM